MVDAAGVRHRRGRGAHRGAREGRPLRRLPPRHGAGHRRRRGRPRRRHAEQRPGPHPARPAQYTLCCDDSGGVVDDLIVYFFDEDKLLLVPNAANAAEVVRRLAEAAPADVRVSDEHADHAVLAVQGPAAEAVLRDVGLPTGHDYMSFREAEGFAALGAPVVVCRTGYTGERGYELITPAVAAGDLWTPSWRPVGPTASPRPVSAPATRCAPRWAIPSTARTSPPTPPRCRRGCGGPWAGTSRRSGVPRPCAPSARRARPAPCAACGPSAAGSRARA